MEHGKRADLAQRSRHGAGCVMDGYDAARFDLGLTFVRCAGKGWMDAARHAETAREPRRRHFVASSAPWGTSVLLIATSFLRCLPWVAH